MYHHMLLSLSLVINNISLNVVLCMVVCVTKIFFSFVSLSFYVSSTEIIITALSTQKSNHNLSFVPTKIYDVHKNIPVNPVLNNYQWELCMHERSLYRHRKVLFLILGFCFSAVSDRSSLQFRWLGQPEGDHADQHRVWGSGYFYKN